MLDQQCVAHTFIKAGVYYYTRRVPKGVRHHYACKLISFSLRTKLASVASKRAQQMSARFEHVWFQLSLGNKAEHKGILDNEADIDVPKLSQALTYYLQQKAGSKSKNFTQSNHIACNAVFALAGDKPINQYQRKDAMQLRDYLVNKKLAGTTVRRNVGCVRTIINFAMSEYSLEMNNPFHNIFIEKQARTVRRLPVPLDRLIAIQQECVEIGDERRLLILLLSGSLMRLSEAAGLLQDDIVMKGDMMTVCIRPNTLRDLKTRSSERQIPLVGVARYAVEVLLCNKSTSLFPKTVGAELKRNSVSAAVNKWLKPRVVKGVTAHSFRHTGRDLLREVECPVPVIDAIGGWVSAKSAGEGYGTGYSLAVMQQHLERAFELVSTRG